MSTKTEENAVTEAKEAVERAEQALVEAKTFQAARALEKLLKAASHGFYELRYAGGFEDPRLTKLEEQFQALRNTFSNLAFGAKKRYQQLHKLDPERWHLRGEFAHDLSGYTKDEHVSYAIATWVFDSGFGRGSETAFAELSADEKVRFHAAHAKALECCGEAGIRGFEFWAEGRHDT
jgi:hypothetical protein